jgi:hypothetical protein
MEARDYNRFNSHKMQVRQAVHSYVLTQIGVWTTSALSYLMF